MFQCVVRHGAFEFARQRAGRIEDIQKIPQLVAHRERTRNSRGSDQAFEAAANRVQNVIRIAVAFCQTQVGLAMGASLNFSNGFIVSSLRWRAGADVTTCCLVLREVEFGFLEVCRSSFVIDCPFGAWGLFLWQGAGLNTISEAVFLSSGELQLNDRNTDGLTE